MGKPLLTVIRDLALDPAEKAAFEAAPREYLNHQGYGGVTAEELREAVSLAADTMDAQVAQAIVPPEGSDADIVEVLQQVTHGADPGFDEAATSATGTAGEASGPAEEAQAPAEGSGPDLAFGAGSANEPGFEGLELGGGDPAGTFGFDEPPPAEGEDGGLDFGSPLPTGSAPHDQLDFEDDHFQAADDLAGQLDDAGFGLPADSAPDDIGAF